MPRAAVWPFGAQGNFAYIKNQFLRSRRVNFGLGADDHIANTPPGRSAACAAPKPAAL